MADAESRSRAQTGSPLYLRGEELRQGVNLSFFAPRNNGAGTHTLQGSRRALSRLVEDRKTKGALP